MKFMRSTASGHRLPFGTSTEQIFVGPHTISLKCRGSLLAIDLLIRRSLVREMLDLMIANGAK
jgi:hypothetical protein